MKSILQPSCVLKHVSSFMHHPILFRNSNIVRSMSTAQFVQVKVGGLPFSLAVNDIKKYPGNIFVKTKYRKEKNSVDRDASLFPFVQSFLATGQLPRDKSGTTVLTSTELKQIREEARFYGLQELSDQCDEALTLPYARQLDKRFPRWPHQTQDVEYDIEGAAGTLIASLRDVWSPFCVTGEIKLRSNDPIINSSLGKLNITALLTQAKQSAFGRGTETVTDTSVRNSFEIHASELQPGVAESIVDQYVDISSLSRSQNLVLRPYKLVIYKEGGHFDAHRDTVRGNGHIGTLVVVLNSDYTGGELEVSHGGRTETVTGVYSWVAMYGDCLHKINPVTSGTRVSLIYDIYNDSADTLQGNNTAIDSSVVSNKAFKVYEDINPDADFEHEYSDEIDDEDDGAYETQHQKRVFWLSGHQFNREEAVHAVDTSTLRTIHTEINRELNNVDSLVITLQHLYPECQTSPAFLKGGDRALYDLLSEQYEVQVVAVRLQRLRDPRLTSFYERSDPVFGDVYSPSNTADNTKADEKMKIIVSNHMHPDSVLDYTPYMSYTGNECQAEETVYIVAGLQLRKLFRSKGSCRPALPPHVQPL